MFNTSGHLLDERGSIIGVEAAKGSAAYASGFAAQTGHAINGAEAALSKHSGALVINAQRVAAAGAAIAAAAQASAAERKAMEAAEKAAAAAAAAARLVILDEILGKVNQARRAAELTRIAADAARFAFEALPIVDRTPANQAFADSARQTALKAQQALQSLYPKVAKIGSSDEESSESSEPIPDTPLTLAIKELFVGILPVIPYTPYSAGVQKLVEDFAHGKQEWSSYFELFSMLALLFSPFGLYVKFAGQFVSSLRYLYNEIIMLQNVQIGRMIAGTIAVASPWGDPPWFGSLMAFMPMVAEKFIPGIHDSSAPQVGPGAPSLPPEISPLESWQGTPVSIGEKLKIAITGGNGESAPWDLGVANKFGDLLWSEVRNEFALTGVGLKPGETPSFGIEFKRANGELSIPVKFIGWNIDKPAGPQGKVQGTIFKMKSFVEILEEWDRKGQAQNPSGLSKISQNEWNDMMRKAKDGKSNPSPLPSIHEYIDLIKIREDPVVEHEN